MLSDFLKEGIMFNGRKNTVIGLTAIFTFVLVELAAVVCTVAWCFSWPSTWTCRFCLPATIETAPIYPSLNASCRYRWSAALHA